jgi:hypothetical protein
MYAVQGSDGIQMHTYKGWRTNGRCADGVRGTLRVYADGVRGTLRVYSQAGGCGNAASERGLLNLHSRV